MLLNSFIRLLFVDGLLKLSRLLSGEVRVKSDVLSTNGARIPGENRGQVNE